MRNFRMLLLGSDGFIEKLQRLFRPAELLDAQPDHLRVSDMRRFPAVRLEPTEYRRLRASRGSESVHRTTEDFGNSVILR